MLNKASIPAIRSVSESTSTNPKPACAASPAELDIYCFCHNYICQYSHSVWCCQTLTVAGCLLAGDSKFSRRWTDPMLLSRTATGHPPRKVANLGGSKCLGQSTLIFLQHFLALAQELLVLLKQDEAS